MAYNKDILGWMTEHELQIIEKLAQRVPNEGLIVEVGSMFGRSSICWALSSPGSDVYCIDIFEMYKPWHNIPEETCKHNMFPVPGKVYNTYSEFKKNTDNIPNIHMIRGCSPQDVPQFNKEIDLFFLDAAHSNPTDWENLSYFVPLIRSGGVLCGHDYSEFFPDVVDNVNRISLQAGIPVETFEGSSLWSITLSKKIDKLIWI